MAEEIRVYKGVSDIDDGVSPGKPQLSFRLKPEARGLQITTRDLAEQVRNSFYGSEALRQQRGRNEMKVMVRLPEEERKTIGTIEELVIRTPQGGEIPISEAADVIYERAYTSISHADGSRIQSVTADVDEDVANANQIIDEVKDEILPVLLQKYPGLSYNFEGEQREQQESLEALSVGFIFALFVIYACIRSRGSEGRPTQQSTKQLVVAYPHYPVNGYLCFACYSFPQLYTALNRYAKYSIWNNRSDTGPHFIRL